MGRPKLKDVSCSTLNCNGMAKENRDNPLCKKCRNLISAKKYQKLHFLRPENDVKSSVSGTVYLLHPCEFKHMDYPIYKIGRTSNLKKRKQYYGGITEIIAATSVADMFTMEKKLIKVFDTHFIRQPEIGNEYFRGDIEKMKDIFEEITMEIPKEIQVQNFKNAILSHDETSTKVFQSLYADIERFIEQDPNTDMKEEDRAHPVIVHPCVIRCAQVLLIQDDPNLTHEEKIIRLQQIEREYTDEV